MFLEFNFTIKNIWDGNLMWIFTSSLRSHRALINMSLCRFTFSNIYHCCDIYTINNLRQNKIIIINCHNPPRLRPYHQTPTPPPIPILTKLETEDSFEAITTIDATVSCLNFLASSWDHLSSAEIFKERFRPSGTCELVVEYGKYTPTSTTHNSDQ